MPVSKIRSFTDLVAWQQAHTFALSIYGATSNFFPRNEYILRDQMRRCAISITSNIAEGFSRRTAKDKTQFYYIALGSTTEIQNQLLLAKDLAYLEIVFFNSQAKDSVVVHQLIFGLIKSSRTS